jgi:NAD(P)-dependent dehydrogenase (short-subunit alcohol dehydrogenase family)
VGGTETPCQHGGRSTRRPKFLGLGVQYSHSNVGRLLQQSSTAYLQTMRQAAAAKTVPLGRVGRLKEVGFLAVFLASPAAAYVTGQTWAVHGGVSIKTA